MRERYVVINGSINGKELTVPTKKNSERKLQTETHTVIGKEPGVQTKNQKREQSGGNNKEEMGLKPEHNEQKKQTIETLRQTIKEWDIS